MTHPAFPQSIIDVLCTGDDAVSLDSALDLFNEVAKQLLHDGRDTTQAIAAVSLLREEAAFLDASKPDREEIVRRWNAKVSSVSEMLAASKAALAASEPAKKRHYTKRAQSQTPVRTDL